MLLGLNPRKKKAFIATRHKLAKAAAKGIMKEEDIMREFKNVYSESLTD